MLRLSCPQIFASLVFFVLWEWAGEGDTRSFDSPRASGRPRPVISFVALQLNKLRRRIEDTDNPSLCASRDNPSLLASSDEKAERLWTVVKGKVATMDVAAGQRQTLGAPPGGRSAGVPVGLLGRARCLQSTRFPFAETGARMSVAWYSTCLDVPIVHDSCSARLGQALAHRPRGLFLPRRVA